MNGYSVIFNHSGGTRASELMAYLKVEPSSDAVSKEIFRCTVGATDRQQIFGLTFYYDKDIVSSVRRLLLMVHTKKESFNVVMSQLCLGRLKRGARVAFDQRYIASAIDEVNIDVTKSTFTIEPIRKKRTQDTYQSMLDEVLRSSCIKNMCVKSVMSTIDALGRNIIASAFSPKNIRKDELFVGCQKPRNEAGEIPVLHL